MTQAPLTLRRWKRLEYDRLVDLGVFERDPVELIGGHLVVAEPHGSYHASAITAVDYAVRASLPPGWIVNLVDRVVEVYREPIPDSSAAFGWRYRSVVVLTPADVAVPLAFPQIRIPVADLLP